MEQQERQRPPKPPGLVWSRNQRLNEKWTKERGDPDPMYFDENLWQWVYGEKP